MYTGLPNLGLNSYQAGGPALNLDFLSTETPDSRITFSGGANGTRMNSSGVIVAASCPRYDYNNPRTNLAKWSEDLSRTAGWSFGTVLVIAAVGVYFGGSSQYWECKKNGTGSSASTSQNLGTSSANTTYAYTLALRSGTSSQVSVGIGATADAAQDPNLWGGGSFTTARIVSGPGNILNNNGLVSVTNLTPDQDTVVEVTRHYLTAGISFGVYIYPDTSSSTTMGASILATRVQCEVGSAGTNYIPTTTTAVTVASAAGLLVEEQRTNLTKWSTDFTNTVWNNAAPNTCSATLAQGIAPDGTNSWNLLTAATGGINSQVRQNNGAVSAAIGTAFTASVYLKAGTSTSTTLQLSDETGTFTTVGSLTVSWSGGVPSMSANPSGTYTITQSQPGVYRITVTGNSVALNAAMGFAIFPDAAAGTNTVYAWGAQVEQGAFASSYIPTTSAQVTRTADSTLMSGTNFSSWFNTAAGTVFVSGDVMFTGGASANAAVQIDNGSTSGNRYLLYAPAGASPVFRFYSDPSATSAGGPTATTGSHKLAGTYDASVLNISVDGAAGTQSGYTPPTGLVRMSIGAIGISSNFWNGHIKNVRYYSSVIPMAQLQVLTT